MYGLGLLEAVASASETVERAQEFVRGGPLTDMLEQMGDVHLQSAIEHVRQAAESTDPRSRLVQATGDLQNAYIFFARAAGAGPSRKLRILFDMANLARSRQGAINCASAVALIQWTLGESVVNQRQWLDRLSRHSVVFADELRQRWEMGNPEQYMDFGARRTVMFRSLRTLEMNLLPTSYQRAGLLRDEDADQHRRPTDRDRYNPDVVMARFYCEQELLRPWSDAMA